jgi:hypothetical protein
MCPARGEFDGGGPADAGTRTRDQYNLTLGFLVHAIASERLDALLAAAQDFSVVEWQLAAAQGYIFANRNSSAAQSILRTHRFLNVLGL